MPSTSHPESADNTSAKKAQRAPFQSLVLAMRSRYFYLRKKAVPFTRSYSMHLALTMHHYMSPTILMLLTVCEQIADSYCQQRRIMVARYLNRSHCFPNVKSIDALQISHNNYLAWTAGSSSYVSRRRQAWLVTIR
jgi:hypothetical protein